MQIEKIIELLGFPSTDSKIESVLRYFGIRNRPEVQYNLSDTNREIINYQDWVINSSLGIEFGFEEASSWLGYEDETDVGVIEMILTQIYFYGEHPGVKPYHGDLPHNLDISDSRSTVGAKLAWMEKNKRSFIRDTWELENYRITVNYVEDYSKIGFILCLLRKPPLPPYEPLILSFPPIDEIVGLLGKDLNDTVFNKIILPGRILKNLEDDGAGGRIANFCDTHGFEFTFSKKLPSNKFIAKHRNNYFLTELVFFRDREQGARGWEGPLPFGISFDDSPDSLIEKVNQQPDELDYDEFKGNMIWHLDIYTLHIFFSTIENLILQVRILAPGVWAAYRES